MVFVRNSRIESDKLPSDSAFHCFWNLLNSGMTSTYGAGSRVSLALSNASLKPQGSERLWKPTVSGPDYTTTTYGILKILIIGFSVAGFISLMITVGRHVDSGRYGSYFSCTALTAITYAIVFAFSRLRVFDPRKPSLPHQIERLAGVTFLIWNFVSACLIAPEPKAPQIPDVPYHEQVHCRSGLPDEICRGSTMFSTVVGFFLSLLLVVNFVLAVYWGPPLRYSMRFKNLTEGEKYNNFTNVLDEE
ncbi:hypothetical protein RvY_14944 [Ramazzottius varieornatus]|uniref:MARVEL domain-containing protein n=1 Tax=Ramazzottius varieornatus TaxID=947166 RepID=A0A1D1VT44_RAMVA|nr:hypothetical protein RvY_14944 [Ramazzottius varieornatus]